MQHQRMITTRTGDEIMTIGNLMRQASFDPRQAFIYDSEAQQAITARQQSVMEALGMRVEGDQLIINNHQLNIRLPLTGAPAFPLPISITGQSIAGTNIPVSMQAGEISFVPAGATHHHKATLMAFPPIGQEIDPMLDAFAQFQNRTALIFGLAAALGADKEALRTLQEEVRNISRPYLEQTPYYHALHDYTLNCLTIAKSGQSHDFLQFIKDQRHGYADHSMTSDLMVNPDHVLHRLSITNAAERSEHAM